MPSHSRPGPAPEGATREQDEGESRPQAVRNTTGGDESMRNCPGVSEALPLLLVSAPGRSPPPHEPGTLFAHPHPELSHQRLHSKRGLCKTSSPPASEQLQDDDEGIKAATSSTQPTAGPSAQREKGAGQGQPLCWYLPRPARTSEVREQFL